MKGEEGKKLEVRREDSRGKRVEERGRFGGAEAAMSVEAEAGLRAVATHASNSVVRPSTPRASEWRAQRMDRGSR